MFNYFLYDDSKQDASTTTAKNNSLISILKDKKVMTTSLNKIREKMMILMNSVYVPLYYTLCHLCHSVTQL